MSNLRAVSSWLFAAFIAITLSPLLLMAPTTGCSGGHLNDPSPSPSPSPSASPTPSPTASPTPGGNVLQVRIGGALQTLTGAGAIKSTTTEGRQYLRIQGQAGIPQPTQITVNVPLPIATGTYALGSASTNDRQFGSYQVLIAGGLNAATFDTGTSGSGSVTIESASDTRISGRFTMAVKDAAFGVTISLTDGIFSLPIQ